MVSPVGEDATGDLQKAAGALEAQALVEQELLPADQAQVLSKVGNTFLLSLQKGGICGNKSEITYGWVGIKKHWDI